MSDIYRVEGGVEVISVEAGKVEGGVNGAVLSALVSTVVGTVGAFVVGQVVGKVVPGIWIKLLGINCYYTTLFFPILAAMISRSSKTSTQMILRRR